MTETVLLIHSTGPQGPREGSDPLVGRLRTELGEGYEVLFPKMPDPEHPRYEPWRDRLGEELAAVDGRVILFGHSLGGSVLLKYAPERGFEVPVAGLVTAAAPFWGGGGWEDEWALREGWPAEGPELPPTYLFHSRDDEEIPFAHLELYAERLPAATVIALDGNGHLFAHGDLSEIVETIEGLAG